MRANNSNRVTRDYLLSKSRLRYPVKKFPINSPRTVSDAEKEIFQRLSTPLTMQRPQRIEGIEFRVGLLGPASGLGPLGPHSISRT